MTEEEMIKRCPDIVKVTPQIMNEVAIEILGQSLDFNKTFIENGFDDLVEMIMNLEKKLNIVIFDEVAAVFTQGKPPQFVQYNRNKRIEELGL